MPLFILTKKTTTYIKSQSGWLTAVHLPKRVPFQNPVEIKVNSNLQKDICANYFYETEQNLQCSIRKYLRGIRYGPRIQRLT